jgi:hypothetical protein
LLLQVADIDASPGMRMRAAPVELLTHALMTPLTGAALAGAPSVKAVASAETPAMTCFLMMGCMRPRHSKGRATLKPSWFRAVRVACQ